MPRFVVFLFVLLLVGSLHAAEKAASEPNELFGKIRVRLLDKKGVELKSVDVAAETAAPGTVRQRFQFKDTQVDLFSCVDPVSKTVVYRVESPLLESGDVSVGFQFPKVRRLPEMIATTNRAAFGAGKGKISLGWNDKATFNVPKPRQELKVILAEYGATNKWADVTEIVRDLIVGDTLDFRAGNALFGDPAGGIPKEMVFTYSVGDDERQETYRENQPVRIQCDPADAFYRLVPEKKAAFEFVVASGLEKLPETLPTFADAQKHAGSLDAPSLGGGMF